MNITTLDLPNRCYNALKRAGIDTVEELLQHDRAYFLNLRNFGAKSLFDLEWYLNEKGLKLP